MDKSPLSLGPVLIEQNRDGEYLLRRRLHGCELRATAATVAEARLRLEDKLNVFQPLYDHVTKEIKAFDQDVRGDLEFIKMAVREHVYSQYPGIATRKLSKELKKIKVIDPSSMSICLSDVVEKLYSLGKRK